MRNAAWPILTLMLMAVSFVVGRKTGGFHALPAIAATLPGVEADFSQELDGRIRDRFPIGTSEEGLIAYLSDEGFVPQWPRRNDPNESDFIRKGLLCTDVIRVFWRADASGVLTDVSGAYESQCE